MKKILSLLLPLLICGASNAQTSSVFCVQVNCPITITAPTDSALIFGSATITGDTVATYQWKQVSGPTCILVSPTASQTMVRKMSPGTYVFSLIVTTKKGNSLAQSGDSITVAPAPAAPRTVIKVTFQLINGVWTPSFVYSDGSTQ